MKIDSKNIIYNKNDYLTKFNFQLNIKKESNKSANDKFNMSYKRPIPMSNYDYSLFNFIPKMHKEIFIKDFFNNKINKRYFYRYILGKIISELYWDDFIYFLISDKNNDIIAISIFHFIDELYPLNIEYLQKNYLSIGKYILIINPYFTYEHYYEIMCFDTCEIILFENNEQLKIFIDMNNNVKNEDDLVKIGNLMMEKNCYDKAIYYYDKSIKKIEKTINCDLNNKKLYVTIIYKISLAYLNYGYFSKALYYSDYFIKFININSDYLLNDDSIKILKIKIFYIKLKSFIGLRKFQEAYQFYLENKEEIDNVELIKLKEINFKELIEEISMKKENQKGIFDYKKMLIEEKTNFYLNYGDYINNKIIIDFDKEKGLKLICDKNKQIKKGELIIAEKALVSKYTKQNKNNNRKENPWQNLSMTNELIEKIKKFKEDYKIFFILYNGKNKLLNLEERNKSYIKNAEKRIEFLEIKNIIDSNKYSASRNILYENNIGVGLWGYTSIMNHSCNPNVNTFTIGDFMFCFAVRDISSGEELNTLYFSNANHYLLRQEKSKINWGFNCSCQFCLYDKNKINDNKKSYYEKSLEEFFDIKDDKLSHEKKESKFIEFEKFLIENNNSMTKYELAKGYLQLIYHYGVMNNIEKSKSFSEKMISFLENDNFYSMILESLNYLFYFFAYKKEINIKFINYLFNRYEKLILNNTNFNKDDFATLIKIALDSE